MAENTGNTRSAASSRAWQLGQMTDEELDAIRHCRLCLEPYERCQCKEGLLRRKEEAVDAVK